MKVFVDGILYDAEKTPIALIFDNDSDRIVVGNQICTMRPVDSVRIYSQFNTELPITDKEKFMDDALNAHTKSLKQ